MRTIIISDIKSKEESIIPYGLHIAKLLESEAEVVHIIDPRIQQGVASSYSDSQTITSGDKLDHEKIIEREMHYANKELDEILIREVSRLNYPLKASKIVQENTIIRKIKELERDIDDPLIIVNSEPDSYIFNTLHEAVSIISKINAASFFVPPGYDYKEFNNILIVPHNSAQDIKKYAWLLEAIFKKEPRVTAFDIINDEEKYKQEKEILENRMKNVSLVSSGPDIETMLFTGHNYFDILEEQIKEIKPDLLISFNEDRGYFNFRSTHSSDLKELNCIAGCIPVLFLS
ncbi:MAG: hypothetical protein U5K32_02145 [Bacteroidales bacterium]|nr:hypothetical protein [Bacteroidales bacterium]